MAGRKRPPPEDLSRDERRELALWFERMQAEGRLPKRLDRRWLRDKVDACLDHYRAQGKQAADYVAAVRNWVRREREWSRPDELPQEMRGRRKPSKIVQGDWTQWTH